MKILNGKISSLARIFVIVLSIMLVMSGCSKPTAQGSKSASPAPSPAASPAASAASVSWTPEKPITAVVCSSTGGSGDILARTVEKVWSKYCPQPILITNKTGGGGVEGSILVSRSKPDGYTMEIGYGSGWDLILPFMENIPYKPLTDMLPVACLSIQPSFLVVPENSPFKTINEVLDKAKKDNKPATVALGTVGCSSDLLVKAIAKITGAPINSVPHTGGGAALTTLLGGNTTLAGNQSPEFAGFLKDKRVRPIVVGSKERDKFLPDVPTLKESGIDLASWGVVKGVVVAPKTPQPIVDYYADVFKKISEDPEYIKIMKDMLQPVNYMGPQEFTKFFKEAYDDYSKLVTDAGLAKK